MPFVSFNNLWQHHRTSGFLMFSGVFERDQWHKIGSCNIKSHVKLLFMAWKVCSKKKGKSGFLIALFSNGTYKPTQLSIIVFNIPQGAGPVLNFKDKICYIISTEKLKHSWR